MRCGLGEKNVNRAIDCTRVTVHAMNNTYQKWPVFYASLPCVPSTAETSTEQGTTGDDTKRRLVSILWDHLATMEHPLWNGCQSSFMSDVPIRVQRGMLGRPQLMVGKNRGPSISFSEGGGRIWAALCADDSDVGIDVAGSDEFPSAYPVQRVFHPEELDHALNLAGGVPEQASALLWSVKEAVVKALGCGFHLVDPRQITVYPLEGESAGERCGHSFLADLSGKARIRFPLTSGRSLRVHSRPERRLWLSIALMNRKPSNHE